MNKQSSLAIVILLALAGLAGGLYFYSTTQTQTSSNQNSPEVAFTPLTTASSSAQSTTDQQIQTTPVDSNQYNDGVYQTTGSYTSPGGRESVQVKLTIEDDVVIDSTVVSLAKHDTSKQYQALFVEGYKSQVIGKNLSDINLSHVSGSSLTSGGFNQALAAIKQRAQVNP